MTNQNGFDLKDLVPSSLNPASESPNHSATPPALLMERVRPEIDVFTYENPKAMVNMLPEGVREKIRETVEKSEHKEMYKLYSEGQESPLNRAVNPSKIDHALRYNLWHQYYRALETGKKTLEVVNIIAGVTTQKTFDHIMSSSRVFWLLLPPTDYTVANRRAHDRALDRLYQVLDLDPAPEGGKINTALINLQLKIFAVLDNRLNGPITHKHEITTKNLHLGISADQVQKLYSETQREVDKLSETKNLNDADIIEIQTNVVKDWQK